MFPFKPIQESATRWAFGSDPDINEVVGEWFRLILEGVISRQARPQPFTQQELQRLQMPVLLLLGQRDGLVGDPDNTINHVQHIPGIQVEKLDTGHLISAERPDQFNRIVIDFIRSETNLLQRRSSMTWRYEDIMLYRMNMRINNYVFHQS